MTSFAPARAVQLLVLALLVAGCSFGGGGDDVGDPTPVRAGASPTATTDPARDPALQRYYGQKLAWSDCGDIQCAKAVVPLDWSKPAGETIELALGRRQASGERIGSLLYNPGGPGVPSLPYLQQGPLFPETLSRAYDVVTWDTRGVGESTSVKCLPNERLDEFYALEASPDDAAEVQQAVATSREYAQACEKNTGALLANVDTLSTVRDMDVLRALVGDEALTYFGASYGTYLGSWYAETFPWRVGRLVLDGAVDPSLDLKGYTDGQALGFSRAIRAYTEDCLKRDGCPLRGTVDEAYDQIEALIERTDATPLRTSSGRRLTQALLTTGLAQGMYVQQLWPTVSKGLGEALQGDGSTMLALADAYNQRDKEGRYSPAIQSSGALFCADHDETRPVEQIQQAAAEVGRTYPPLGTQMGWAPLTCSVWPVEAKVPAKKLTAQGAAPILVVGSTGDPATPYEWAQSLASQLTSGVLLTREGQGHTGYQQGSQCVDTAVNKYLLTGTAPEDGTRCS